MPKRRIKIGILFGGKSAEHEVSLVSAKNVIAGLDKKKYLVVPVRIGRDGKFDIGKLKKLDIVFPVLHGPFGEDGSIQGMLKVLNVPFVGPGVLGSAVGMDKDIAKRLLKEAGIPIGRYVSMSKEEKIDVKKIEKYLGYPMFVKPANMGSSVGISRANDRKGLTEAIKEAFKYDRKIVIEEETKGREIECAVLGNENPKASVLGEIIPTKGFYSYDAKYVNDSAILSAPAKLPKDTAKKIQETAVQAFKALACEGMGRVDFFLLKNGKIYVNEINTIPGFTSISMYPKLWELSGKPLPKLLDELISLSLDRFNKEKKLKSTK